MGETEKGAADVWALGPWRGNMLEQAKSGAPRL